MDNGHDDLGGVVVAGTTASAASADTEVDEVTEQEQLNSDPDTLDSFLRDIHETTTMQEVGLPSLQVLKQQFKTKSAAIRHLYSLGHETKDIAKHLGLRYQHVRNVLHTELKRGPNEDWRFAHDEAKRISPGLDKV